MMTPEEKAALPNLRRVLSRLSEDQIQNLQRRISGHLKRRIAKRETEKKLQLVEKAEADKARMVRVEEWARSFLRPGMIVKVRTSNPNKLRLVTSVAPDTPEERMTFYGEHVLPHAADESDKPVYGVGTNLTKHFGDIVLNVMCHGKDPSNPVIVEPGYEKPTVSISGDDHDWKLVPISKFLGQKARVSEAA